MILNLTHEMRCVTERKQGVVETFPDRRQLGSSTDLPGGIIGIKTLDSTENKRHVRSKRKHDPL
ncbi:hypothetical protein THIOKS12550009 [Thiocapsa sp. KS1]|nr:hypothetical protein THIOKS12550009 [Thiocapsa sp. KS1]